MLRLITTAAAALVLAALSLPAKAGGFYVEEYSYTYVGWPSGPWAEAPYFAAPLYNRPTPPYYAYYPYGSRRHVAYRVRSKTVLRVRY